VTVVLLHSPLLGAGATWGELPARFAGAVVPRIESDELAPYAERYVDAVVAALAPGAGAVTLVPHSGAGPLAAAVAAGVSAAGRQVRQVVFLDAGLPVAFVPGLPAGASRLDLLAAESAAAAAGLVALLDAGGRFPNWAAEQLAGMVPDPGAVVAGMRPRGADFFAEPLPDVPMPADTQLAYVRLSETYQPYADLAAAAGWPVRAAELGHFGPAADPDAVAALLTDVLA
jgi:hypothetical protein